MTERIGVIGVGHLAAFLVEGLRRANPNVDIILSPRNVERSTALAARFGATVATDNQVVANAADVILLTTRPGDAVAVCKGVAFRPEQIVVSTAANLPLATLIPAVAPATAVRAMPISCAALNQSPTLLHPGNTRARTLFKLLGSVHVLEDEAQFTPASVIAALYGWVFALFDETVAWTVGAGVPEHIARNLVVETVRGAADMVLALPEKDMGLMLDALTTPGGITEYGLDILQKEQGLVAWTSALDAVLTRMKAA